MTTESKEGSIAKQLRQGVRDAFAEVRGEVDGHIEDVIEDSMRCRKLAIRFGMLMNEGRYAEAVIAASSLATWARNAAIRLQVSRSRLDGASHIVDAVHFTPTKRIRSGGCAVECEAES